MTNEDDIASKDQARQNALALLSRAQGERMQIEQTALRLGSAGWQHLPQIIASLSSAEVRLARAADAADMGLPADLGGIDALLCSTEQEADTALRNTTTDTVAASARSAAAIYAATRAEVQGLSGDLFERKMFDGYLRFGSSEDQERYRQRETARKREVDDLLAQHTPRADYQAGLLEKGQLVDAGEHGATASPDYQPKLDRLNETLERQRQALDGPSMAHNPVVTVRPDPSVDLAALGITSDPVPLESGHGLPVQVKSPTGRSNGRS